MFTTVQDQQQTGQRQNATILQQNHHVGLLEKKQQLPSYQQNMSTPFNQSLGLQSNVSGLQQQKQFIRARSDLLKRQPHQHALNVLQQPEVAAPQRSVHLTTQPMQLHQLMGLQDQSNSLQESMQKRHHNSVALFPQNGFIDQQKQIEQSQRVLPQASSASLDSTCQIECATLADWHDQAYCEVESVSPKALSASVRDIGLVINTIDRIAGTTTYDEFGVAISDDLAADISHCLQGRNFSLDCESTSSKRKRHISTTKSDFLSLLLNENDGLERLCCQTLDVVSTATSRIKRPRIELNDALLEEIKEINQKLVETVIDVISDSTEYAAKGGFGEGTIVRCSYSALGLGGNFKQQYSSSRMLSILPVQLLVPADYPNSSPILVNTSPIGKRDARELENQSQRARLRFSLSLCELSQPMSLGEMARTWHVCAHTVLSEFAQSMGGGSFSTTYGTWENCITAS
ncbi:hypothetical protein ACSBR2_021677 [Camellia fascicularis]